MQKRKEGVSKDKSSFIPPHYKLKISKPISHYHHHHNNPRRKAEKAFIISGTIGQREAVLLLAVGGKERNSHCEPSVVFVRKQRIRLEFGSSEDKKGAE